MVQSPPVTPRYETFHDAFLAQLRAVCEAPTFRNAPRGFHSRERLGVAFALSSPVDRMVYAAARKPNLVFNFAEALWYLSGSDSVEHIAYYAPSMRKYSRDGERLTGTAYGPKIFGPVVAGAQSQWACAKQTIMDDPDTKRALISIFRPDEYLVPDNIDVSCTVGLQFFLREGRLCAATYMRANDAFRGVCSDVFSFTLLQEVLATELGVQVGEYHHFAGSYHVYDTDYEWARRVLAEADGRAYPLRERRFPRMPRQNNWEDIRAVIELEPKLRTNAVRLEAEEVEDLVLDPYWRDVVCLFELYRQLVYEDRMSPEHFSLLHPLYQSLLQSKWPSSMELVLQR